MNDSRTAAPAPITGSVLNMIPESRYVAVVTFKDGQETRCPVIGWATVVTWTSGEDEPDGPREYDAEVQGVMMLSPLGPRTAHDLRDAYGASRVVYHQKETA